MAKRRIALARVHFPVPWTMRTTILSAYRFLPFEQKPIKGSTFGQIHLFIYFNSTTSHTTSTTLNQQPKWRPLDHSLLPSPWWLPWPSPLLLVPSVSSVTLISISVVTSLTNALCNLEVIRQLPCVFSLLRTKHGDVSFFIKILNRGQPRWVRKAMWNRIPEVRCFS